MIENLQFSEEEIFERLVEEGMAAGVVTEEGYHSLVEGMLEDMLDMGEVSDDQNMEGHETNLKSRWPEYRARLTAEGNE